MPSLRQKIVSFLRIPVIRQISVMLLRVILFLQIERRKDHSAIEPFTIM